MKSTKFLKFKNKKKLVALTAYDCPTARILDESNVDLILVGDSLGMVVLGYESTREVSMDDMLHHLKAVRRGVTKTLVVADMPFGSYRTTTQALKNAKLLMKAGADGVKVEGGTKIKKVIEHLIKNKIPVMGHVGLTPQDVKSKKDYRVKGREIKEALKILQDAVFLDQAGAFSIVLECIPSELGEEITQAVKCPTVGIGAGKNVDGQILVTPDLLGVSSGVQPRFVRRYAKTEESIKKAIERFVNDVESGKYPNKKETY